MWTQFEPVWMFFKEWYWIPLTLVYVTVIITILIENRNPSKTIAWIMIIAFVPVIGMLLYFLLGQDLKKDFYFKKIEKKQLRIIKNRWAKMNDHIQDVLNDAELAIGSLSKIYHYLNNMYVAPPTTNNKVELLINGEEKFPSFIQAIESAKHHIHLEYYIFEEDNIGNQIIDILCHKAQSGVEVRMMVDDFGSPKLKKHKQKMLSCGIAFQTFLPVTFASLADSNYRNHRKILIVDGSIAFVGGINISDYYINKLGNELYWRDTSIRIEGAAVNALQIRFWMNWSTMQGLPLNINNPAYFYDNSIQQAQHALVSFAFTTPNESVNSAMESLVLGISLAQKSIKITTPYFIPNDEFVNAIITAVGAGVEVELMIPFKGDSKIVHWASLSFLKPLFERGVKVFQYHKGFMHAKTMIVDDTLAYIGTVNIDNRSFYINYEINAIVHEPLLLQKMVAQYSEDKKDAYLFTLNKWKRVPVLYRGLASICRLLAPIL